MSKQRAGRRHGADWAMKRSQAVDVSRGLIIALMVLDHVRVYSGVPAGGPEPAVFLTRWVTNFCAPAFFFLAGVSGFLSMQKRGRIAAARTFLLRGVWLIFLELTVIRMSWTFQIDSGGYLLGGVIWSLGCSMVVMSGLVFMPRRVLLGLALLVICTHDAFAAVYMTGSPWREEYHWAWRLAYTGGIVEVGDEGCQFLVLYSVLPWLAVMAAGMGFGAVFRMDPRRRDRVCLVVGGGMIGAFLLLRGLDVYGDPRPRHSFSAEWPRWIAFLNANKYPASLAFLLMTLGPVILALPMLERLRGRGAAVLATFGRVPLFFYLLHIPLIHALALCVAGVRSPEACGWLLGGHPLPMQRPPDGYAYGLPLLYGFAVVVLVLSYSACRWYEGVRWRLPWRLGMLL